MTVSWPRVRVRLRVPTLSVWHLWPAVFAVWMAAALVGWPRLGGFVVALFAIAWLIVAGLHLAAAADTPTSASTSVLPLPRGPHVFERCESCGRLRPVGALSAGGFCQDGCAAPTRAA